MRRNKNRATIVAAGSALLLLLGGAVAQAGEADDLQRAIDIQRSGVADLERTDDRRSTTDEIALLRAWLDEAWAQHMKQDYDLVREILDRCTAQAEMIRHKIAAAKLSADAQGREAALKRARDNLDRTRRALQQAHLRKATLQGAMGGAGTK